MMEFTVKEQYGIQDLIALIQLLRDPVNGCPWDREQTHHSIRMNFIEEAYEAVEAIDREDRHMLMEELGDVLLQVLLHTEMERQAGSFDLDDVSDCLCKKLVLRHPHLFGEVKVEGSHDVLSNWEDIKRREKRQLTGSDAIDDVPLALPALMRIQKTLKRAAYTGFAYSDVESAMEDVSLEMMELLEAVSLGLDPKMEIGDLIVAVVNVANLLKLDAEQCAGDAALKFSTRFREVERIARETNLDMHSLTDEELEELWEKGKEAARGKKG